MTETDHPEDTNGQVEDDMPAVLVVSCGDCGRQLDVPRATFRNTGHRIFPCPCGEGADLDHARRHSDWTF